MSTNQDRKKELAKRMFNLTVELGCTTALAYDYDMTAESVVGKDKADELLNGLDDCMGIIQATFDTEYMNTKPVEIVAEKMEAQILEFINLVNEYNSIDDNVVH